MIPFVAKRSNWIMIFFFILIYFIITFLDFFMENRVLKKEDLDNSIDDMNDPICGQEIWLDYDFVFILIYFNITFLDFFRENRVLKKRRT